MRTRTLPILLNGIMILLCASCRSYHVSLTYAPPEPSAQIYRGNPELRVGRINDTRHIKGTEIGAIRNEFGIPIKILHGKRPMAQIVHSAFTYALNIRNMSTMDNPGYTLSADILELWCHQYTTQDAACRVQVNIYSTSDNRLVFSKRYAAKHTHPTLKVTYWSNVEEVADVVSRVLQSAVDSALDDPELRRAIRHKSDGSS